VVNAVAQIDVKTPRLTKELFVAGGAAAIAVAGGVVLGMRLRLAGPARMPIALFESALL
jgi:hypothetical protein